MARRRLNYIDLVPKEILTENIFSRLPIKSLGECKCVCKPWNSTISDPHFVKTQLTKTPNLTKFIFISFKPNPGLLYSAALENNPKSNGIGMNLKFDCSNTWSRIWGSCDGLVLAEDERVQTSMYVLNPTTLESRQLPVLPCLRSKCENVCMFGFGYESFSDDYAVVAISYRRYGSKKDACVYVHMLRENNWDKVGLSPYDHKRDSDELGAGMFVGGSLHWLARNVNNSSRLISAFTISNRKFSQVAVPDGVFGSSVTSSRLGVLKGCLCLIDIVDLMTISELWVMKEYGVVESWIKLSIDISKVYPVVPLHLREDNLVETDTFVLVVTNAEEAKPYRYHEVIISQSLIKYGRTYVESLVSPNIKDGNQKNKTGRKLKPTK